MHAWIQNKILIYAYSQTTVNKLLCMDTHTYTHKKLTSLHKHTCMHILFLILLKRGKIVVDGFETAQKSTPNSGSLKERIIEYLILTH